MQLPAAVFEGKATMGQLAKNWAGSYLGNALGCALGCFLLLNCGLMVRGTIGAAGGRRGGAGRHCQGRTQRSHIALGKKRRRAGSRLLWTSCCCGAAPAPTDIYGASQRLHTLAAPVYQRHQRHLRCQGVVPLQGGKGCLELDFSQSSSQKGVTHNAVGEPGGDVWDELANRCCKLQPAKDK